MLLYQRLTQSRIPRPSSTSTALTLNSSKLLSVRNVALETLLPEICWGRNPNVTLKHPLARRNLFCYILLISSLSHFNNHS